MDWEAPVDGWYVWLAVALVSIAFVGIALSLPSGPPPDANRAANSIDDVAGSNYEASARMEHDADAVKIEGRVIEMRNDHGTSRSNLAFREAVLVNGHDRLENLVYGSSVDDEYNHSSILISTAYDNLLTDVDEAWGNRSEWHQADGELVVRTVSWDPGIIAGLDGGLPDTFGEHPDWLHVEDSRYYVTLVVA